MNNKPTASQRSVAKAETLRGELDDLRAFCRVADLGSITLAAKSLGETKGTVSRRMTRLESQLGVQLLRRAARKLTLSEDGLAFRERLGAALELLDEAALLLKDTRSEPKGTVRITAPGDLSTLLAPMFSEFARTHPELRLELLLTQAQLDFAEHQLDLALRAAGGLKDSDLVAHRLLELSMGFYTSKAYYASKGPWAEPTELLQHPLVLMRHPPRDFAVTLQKRGQPETRQTFELTPAVMVNDYEFVRQFILAGHGVGLLPKGLHTTWSAETQLVELLPDWELVERGSLYLLHARSTVMPARVRSVRDFLLSWSKQKCRQGEETTREGLLSGGSKG